MFDLPTVTSVECLTSSLPVPGDTVGTSGSLRPVDRSDTGELCRSGDLVLNVGDIGGLPNAAASNRRKVILQRLTCVL